MEFINTLSKFADKHIQELRVSSIIVASCGIIIILRRSYSFTQFQNVQAIPAQFFTKHISFKVCVTDVIEKGTTLKGKHCPILFREGWIRHALSGNQYADEGALKMAFAGVEAREGANAFLRETVLNKELKVLPYYISGDDILHVVAFQEKRLLGIFPYNINVNQEMIKKGLGVVFHDRDAPSSKHYQKVIAKLLQAELDAERKGRGMWVKPPITKRIATMLVNMTKRIKTYLLFWNK